MYIQVCVSKAKSASLSPSYIWEAELIPLALFIACQILEIVEANTFQETSYHIAWNDFWPRLLFCHSKCWPISLTLSQLVTVPGLKMTSSEKFDLDLAQEYQISWTGDLDTSSQTLGSAKSKMSVSCHPLNSSQNIHLGRIIRSNSLLISKFKPNAL